MILNLYPDYYRHPPYHRAIFKFDAYPSPSAEDADRLVQLRVERQGAAFDRTPPLRIRAVLGGGVLAREVGGAKFMAEQGQDLLKVSMRPHVQVSILT